MAKGYNLIGKYNVLVEIKKETPLNFTIKIRGDLVRMANIIGKDLHTCGLAAIFIILAQARLGKIGMLIKGFVSKNSYFNTPNYRLLPYGRCMQRPYKREAVVVRHIRHSCARMTFLQFF